MSHILKKLKTLMHTYSHAWVLLYTFIYFPWFTYLERHVTDNYFVIHSIFDDYIPFCEYFIIPYLLWFAYIAVTLGYLFFNDKQGFYKASAIMFSGMTIFLIICTVFPNGLNLRPEVFTRDNFCIELVKRIYQTDTPTNVLPSLHVYNSICCYIAISHCEKLQHSRLIQKGSLVLSILIILSTMFLKQHSVVDVVAACVMAYFLYTLIYAQEGAKSPRLARQVI